MLAALLTMLTLSGSGPAVAGGPGLPPPRTVQAACSAPIGNRPHLRGVTVTAVPATAGDLPALRIENRRTGDWMLAYHGE